MRQAGWRFAASNGLATEQTVYVDVYTQHYLIFCEPNSGHHRVVIVAAKINMAIIRSHADRLRD